MQKEDRIVDYLLDEFQFKLSKAKIDFLVSQLLDETKGLSSLLFLLSHKNNRVRYNASWIFIHYCEKEKNEAIQFLEFLQSIIEKEKELGVKRNVLRALQTLALANPIENLSLFDLCIRLITSKEEPVATKSYASTIAYELAKNSRELLKELRIILEDQMSKESSFFISRSKMILKKIDKQLLKNPSKENS